MPSIRNRMNDDQIQDLINNEIAASDIMLENYRADGRATVESVRAQRDARVAEISNIGTYECDAITAMYSKMGSVMVEGARDLSKDYGKIRLQQARHLEGVEEESIQRMFEAESNAKVQATEELNNAKIKQLKKLAVTEDILTKELFDAVEDAKTTAIDEEHKAALKELKQTREHERKCITKMLDAEAAARVSAVQAESEERKVLMRQRMKLEMELMREESTARREASREKGILEAGRASSEVSRDSVGVSVAAAKRKRVL